LRLIKFCIKQVLDCGDNKDKYGSQDWLRLGSGDGDVFGRLTEFPDFFDSGDTGKS
jgi:hypothetical protein